jgi:hypothetical protein
MRLGMHILKRLQKCIKLGLQPVQQVPGSTQHALLRRALTLYSLERRTHRALYRRGGSTIFTDLNELSSTTDEFRGKKGPQAKELHQGSRRSTRPSSAMYV